MDIHTVTIKVNRLVGDGITPVAPQVLKEVTYVFLDKDKFEQFIEGLEYVFLSKVANGTDM